MGYTTYIAQTNITIAVKIPTKHAHFDEILKRVRKTELSILIPCKSPVGSTGRFGKEFNTDGGFKIFDKNVLMDVDNVKDAEFVYVAIILENVGAEIDAGLDYGGFFSFSTTDFDVFQRLCRESIKNIYLELNMLVSKDEMKVVVLNLPTKYQYAED